MLDLAPARARPTVDQAMVRQPKLCGPHTTVGEARAVLLDPHVHAVLVVEAGRLVAVVERGDVDGVPAERPARTAGRLEGRAVRTGPELRAAQDAMAATGRRRLAVVDPDGCLVGLLCLKRSGLGFCSDDGVAARAAQRCAGPT